MENNYVSTKKAKEILGVHMQTLYNWEKNGKIDTIRTAGNQRKYNVEKYLKTYGKGDYEEENIEEEIKEDNKKRLNICYVRVSTLNQKDDLERQKEYMMEKYKDYK